MSSTACSLLMAVSSNYLYFYHILLFFLYNFTRLIKNAKYYTIFYNTILFSEKLSVLSEQHSTESNSRTSCAIARCPV